ncbi:MAG: PorV/PorQ family protein [candidate division Zixibacteria bacterium]|nr:PorV/PorQ family protein [candidate division Zixibacteria bacterium]
MKIKLFAFLAVLLILSLAGTGYSGEFSRVGTAGAQFLKIGMGARYVAMGEASVACVNDAYAMYWNPAALTEISSSNLSLTNVDWISDVQLNHASFARSLGEYSAFGVSVTALSMGDIEVTTVQEPEGTGETFTASSYALSLGYARKFTDRFSVGISGKYIWERISEERASGFAFDFGTLFYTGFKSLRVGMNISNLGPDMKLEGPELDAYYNPEPNNPNYDNVKAKLTVDPYDLPLTFRFGVAYDLVDSPESKFTVSMEAKHPNDNVQQASLGGEYRWKETFSLRGGYKLNYEEEGLTLGAGMKFNAGKNTKLDISYAWADFSRLSSVHRFSLGFEF